MARGRFFLRLLLTALAASATTRSAFHISGQSGVCSIRWGRRLSIEAGSPAFSFLESRRAATSAAVASPHHRSFMPVILAGRRPEGQSSRTTGGSVRRTLRGTEEPLKASVDSQLMGQCFSPREVHSGIFMPVGGGTTIGRHGQNPLLVPLIPIRWSPRRSSSHTRAWLFAQSRICAKNTCRRAWPAAGRD
jgi:hypothetical protein